MGLRQSRCLNEPRARFVSVQTLLNWIQAQAQHIRDNCNPRHCNPPKLLSIGGVEHSQLQTIFSSLPSGLIDLVDTHLYPHPSLNPTQADQAVQNAATYAVNTLNKPFYLGEFGIDSNAGRTRHVEYQNWSSTLAAAGASGLLFWQLLPQSRTAWDKNEIHVQAAPSPLLQPPLQGVLGTFNGAARPGPLLSAVNQVVGFVNNARSQWPNC